MMRPGSKYLHFGLAEGSHFALIEVFNEGVIGGGTSWAASLLPFHDLICVSNFWVPAELADGCALAPV